MRDLVILELAILATLWVAFIAFHGRTGGWKSRVGRQLIAMAAVGIVEALALIALGLGHPLPLWAYALIFGITDLVAAGWLALLWKARSNNPPPPP